MQAYSPLGSGRVPVLQVAEVREVASRTGRSPAQVCLRRSVQKGMVIKRGCRTATITPSGIVVPNRARFAIRSALHYAAIGALLRRRRTR